MSSTTPSVTLVLMQVREFATQGKILYAVPAGWMMLIASERLTASVPFKIVK